MESKDSEFFYYSLCFCLPTNRPVCDYGQSHLLVIDFEKIKFLILIPQI